LYKSCGDPKDIHLREYQAIDAQDRTRRRSIEFRLKDGRRVWLKYADRHLMMLSPDRRELTLAFYSIGVSLKGQNLGEVATAIDGENVAFLQEFDAVRFDRPDDELVPVIESVELFEPKTGEVER